MNEYSHAACVAATKKAPELGKEIRSELLDTEGGGEDRDWTLLLFFDELVLVSASGEDVADLLGYSNNFPVRFFKVIQDRLKNVTEEYGSVDGFVDSIRTDV